MTADERKDAAYDEQMLRSDVNISNLVWWVFNGEEEMTQCEAVYSYLHEFGTITPIEALRDLGVMRLSARIGDLRERKVLIDMEMVGGENRWGKKIKYAQYSLHKGATT